MLTMIRTFTVLFFLALTGLVTVAAAESSQGERYRQARALFESGDYKGAEAICRELLEQRHLSPELFQLLGHLSYRKDDLGHAALWYERAALFPPPSMEVRQNIAHIHDRTGNVNFASNRFHEQYAAYFTRTDWFHALVASAWVFVFALAAYHAFARSSGWRTFLMLIRVLSVAAATLAGLGWYWHVSYAKVKDLALVTAADARVHTAASTTSGSVMNIPPGSGVRKLQERGAWAYVEIPVENELRRGWLPTEKLTILWPYAPGYLE